MKLTNKQLRQIIKEELEAVLEQETFQRVGRLNDRSKIPLQTELVDGLRNMGLAANPSHRGQIINIKGRDGQVVEFDIGKYTMDDYDQALSDAFQKVVAKDTDLSMRRRASTRRMGRGEESITISDPMMETKRRQ